MPEADTLRADIENHTHLSTLACRVFYHSRARRPGILYSDGHEGRFDPIDPIDVLGGCREQHDAKPNTAI